MSENCKIRYNLKGTQVFTRKIHGNQCLLKSGHGKTKRDLYYLEDRTQCSQLSYKREGNIAHLESELLKDIY